MGNLLGSPITEKDTHQGQTVDGLQYGISSMQGWRIHMEDAHIVQPFLYAEKRVLDGSSGGEGDGEGTEVTAPASAATATTTATDNVPIANTVTITTSPPSSPSSNNNSKSNTPRYLRIPLPDHSLFAIFDGHGGSFAAEYASRNLLRVLTRQPAFVRYAERWRTREEHLEKLRLSLLLQRSKESDEEVREIKERVRKFLDGDDGGAVDDGVAGGDGSNANTNNGNNKNALEIARATYDHQLMTLLEYALRDAFCDIDAEILREVRGDGNADANLPYGYGYLNNESESECGGTGVEVCVGVGHLPAEAGGINNNDDSTAKKQHQRQQQMAAPTTTTATTTTATTTTATTTAPTNSSSQQHPTHPTNPPPTTPPIPHPIPTPNPDEDSGTTAVLVLLTPRWIVCANAGDSRSVYSRSNHRAVPLSYDHKPDDEEEERRVKEAGGYVSGGRVEGDLAVSRGLGDFRFKDLDAVGTGAAGENRGGDRSLLVMGNASSSFALPSTASSTTTTSTSSTSSSTTTMQNNNNDEDNTNTTMPMLRPGEQKVSPVPDIIVQNRDVNEDEFIIIACDGIWDVQTNQECVNMVADIFEEGEGNLGLICEEVLDLCLIKGSKDNMTAAVIKFPKQTIGTGGGGVIARRERRGGGDTNNDEHEQLQQQNLHTRQLYNAYAALDQKQQEEHQHGHEHGEEEEEEDEELEVGEVYHDGRIDEDS